MNNKLFSRYRLNNTDKKTEKIVFLKLFTNTKYLVEFATAKVMNIMVS